VDFVNFDDAKKRLGKTDEELQELIKKGELRAFRDGATWKFRKEDIDSRAGAAGEEDAGDTLMSIDADILFAEEEEVPADSAAETWIAADTEGVFPGGAGGGEEQPIGVDTAMAAPETEPPPLALSPESDDTSLHDVLSADEVAGAGGEAGEEPVIAVDSDSGLAAVVSSGTSGIGASRTRIVTLVEPPAHHAAFTVMLGMAIAAVAIALFGTMAMMQGAMPGILERIGSGNTAVVILGVGFVAVGIIFAIGFVLDKQRAARDSFGG
jgi:excisionase family DNA binding protein